MRTPGPAWPGRSFFLVSAKCVFPVDRAFRCIVRKYLDGSDRAYPASSSLLINSIPASFIFSMAPATSAASCVSAAIPSSTANVVKPSELASSAVWSTVSSVGTPQIYTRSTENRCRVSKSFDSVKADRASILRSAPFLITNEPTGKFSSEWSSAPFVPCTQCCGQVPPFSENERCLSVCQS